MLKANNTFVKVLYNLFNIYVGEGVDYSEARKKIYVVTFPAGAICSTFDIPINDDDESENDEMFMMAIMPNSLPFGVELSDTDHTKADVVIVDNDSE